MGAALNIDLTQDHGVAMSKYLLTAYILTLTLSACNHIGDYDVPYDAGGDLTVSSISLRVKCELAALVNDKYPYEDLLLEGDYQVAVNLSLSVNNKGEIKPSFTYIDNPMFSFLGGFTLSRSRERNFYKTIPFSMRQLARDVTRFPNLEQCPAPDTPLAGELGIRQATTMALTSPFDRKIKISGTTGAFGGYINIITTKSIDGLGSKFVLTNFNGPGGFFNGSEVNTDKITFAFAEGPNAGKLFDKRGTGPVALNGAAQNFLNQILLNDISTQLSGIRNSARQ